MSLYSTVKTMEPGTIFRVGEGVAWMRTREGVADLAPGVFWFNHKYDPIPEQWQDPRHDEYPVSVLYTPGVELD